MEKDKFEINLYYNKAQLNVQLFRKNFKTNWEGEKPVTKL